MPSTTDDPSVPQPATQRFELTVQPESAFVPWHAELRDASGQRTDFTSPIELLRHLAALGQSQAPTGHLR